MAPRMEREEFKAATQKAKTTRMTREDALKILNEVFVPTSEEAVVAFLQKLKEKGLLTIPVLDAVRGSD